MTKDNVHILMEVKNVGTEEAPDYKEVPKFFLSPARLPERCKEAECENDRQNGSSRCEAHKRR